MRERSFVVDEGCKRSLAEAGIMSIESVFRFAGGRNLAKSNIGSWRQRIEFRTEDGCTFYLKRYKGAGALTQLRNWLTHGRIGSFAGFDVHPSVELAGAGIQTPRVAAHGEQWGVLFEKRSFSITEQIARGEALERRLPRCFADKSPYGLREKRAFLRRLGKWAAKFHASGWRHRDFYLAHIFLTDSGQFYLIDLQRAFKPIRLAERYRLKDMAQLYYSMPQADFSRTDRMRVYLAYAGTDRLRYSDRKLIAGVLRKAARMARHDRRHGRTAPYERNAQIGAA